jgi:hypothetical protein
MLRRVVIGIVLFSAFLCLHRPVAADQADTLKSNTVAADTSKAAAHPADTTRPQIKPGPTIPDSLQKKAAAKPEEPPLPPPVRLGDSTAYYFSREHIEFNINHNDLYPRNAAGFLVHDASYYAVTYFETPLRTTVFPFGLKSENVSVQSGSSELSPYDRTIPADGSIDFDDIATGDVISATVIEGPLSAYESPGGGLALLRLEPYPIPPDTARSEVTVERGQYGYAYTRARFARMFSKKFGATFSTDYRKGQGALSAYNGTNRDDDSYNIRTRFYRKFGRRTSFNMHINAYRRTGTFPVDPADGADIFHRFRRDNEFLVTWSRQQWLGGQLDGRFDYQSSLTDYKSGSTSFYRTLRPKWYRGDLSYLKVKTGGLYQFTLHAARANYQINGITARRTEGYGMASGFIDRFGGRLFFFGRYLGAQKEHSGFEGAAGMARSIGPNTKILASAGYIRRWPDLADRYAPEREAPLGGPFASYTERGTPGLKSEKKLTADFTVLYTGSRYSLSASGNGGIITDGIYYDWTYPGDSALSVFPANDQIKFIDLNLRCRIDNLGPLFADLSATGRKLQSDRYGSRSPYAPRWQTYAQVGVRHFVDKYKVNLRLFGDITWAEEPLSYRLEGLGNDPMLGGGVNASLKAFTFYFMFHDVASRITYVPEGYGVLGRYYSWGFNWKFLN